MNSEWQKLHTCKRNPYKPHMGLFPLIHSKISHNGPAHWNSTLLNSNKVQLLPYLSSLYKGGGSNISDPMGMREYRYPWWSTVHSSIQENQFCTLQIKLRNILTRRKHLVAFTTTSVIQYRRTSEAEYMWVEIPTMLTFCVLRLGQGKGEDYLGKTFIVQLR